MQERETQLENEVNVRDEYISQLQAQIQEQQRQLHDAHGLAHVSELWREIEAVNTQLGVNVCNGCHMPRRAVWREEYKGGFCACCHPVSTKASMPVFASMCLSCIKACKLLGCQCRGCQNKHCHPK